MKIKIRILLGTFAFTMSLGTLSFAQMMEHWGDSSWDHNERHHMDWPDTAF